MSMYSYDHSSITTVDEYVHTTSPQFYQLNITLDLLLPSSQFRLVIYCSTVFCCSNSCTIKTCTRWCCLNTQWSIGFSLKLNYWYCPLAEGYLYRHIKCSCCFPPNRMETFTKSKEDMTSVHMSLYAFYHMEFKWNHSHPIWREHLSYGVNTDVRGFHYIFLLPAFFFAWHFWMLWETLPCSCSSTHWASRASECSQHALFTACHQISAFHWY